jgi:hypothetical protein
VNAYNSRGKSFVFSLVPAIFSLNLLMQWLIGNVGRGSLLFFLAAWGWLIVSIIMRRKESDHPGGVQVRMSRNGVVQIDDIEKLRKKPEHAAEPRHRWGELAIAKLKIGNAHSIYLKLESRSLQRAFFWIKAREAPINAEVDCPRGDAAEVAGMIRSWLVADAKYLGDLRAEFSKGDSD